MEIKYLENSEKNIIKDLYIEAFNDNEKYVEFLFSSQIFKHEVLVMLDGEKVVSMLQLVPKKIRYRKELLDVYYIFAVATAPEYRKKGYMKELVNKAVLDIEQKGGRFTYLIPTNPDIYKGLGFEYKYKRMYYDIVNVSEENKIYSPTKTDIKIMMSLCENFLPEKYNTFLVHDEEYFDRILKELSFDNGYLVYHTEGEEIVGYSLVGSDSNVLESVFKELPAELLVKDVKPYVMVKIFDDKTDVGKIFINDET